MCIVLLTTAHPSYALILINNRDEFILRPTSRPHWWTPSHTRSSSPPPGPPQPPVLSSRDLHRPEHGTWLGISQAGNLAVLTNYREPHAPPATARSRGSIPAAWLGAPPDEATREFVERLLREDGEGRVQEVGGFSLICGKLRPAEGRKRSGRVLAPLAVISNRAMDASHVPWISHDEECGDARLHVHGLSNAVYVPTAAVAASTETTPEEWPKVRLGKAGLLSTVATAAAEEWDERRLIDGLFGVLDTNTLEVKPGDSFDQMIMRLKTSVFIPAVGDTKATEEMERTRRVAPSTSSEVVNGTTPAAKLVEKMDAAHHGQQRPVHGFETGLYGTQRQTVVLVDWDGNATYVERALYDEWGRELARGTSDEVFKFKIQGWEEDEVHGDDQVNGVEA